MDKPIRMIKKLIIGGLKGTLLVAFGTAMMAFGCAVFLVPFDIVAGGISGIAVIIEKMSLGNVNIDLLIALITWGFFALGVVFLGKSFALKTLLSTALYPSFFALFHMLAREEVLGGYFYLPGCDVYEAALLISALFGGVLVGLGCGLAFLGGGSTGGVDVIALVFKRKIPRLSIGKIMLIADASVIILGAVVIENLVISALGLLSAYVSARTLNFIYESKKMSGSLT